MKTNILDVAKYILKKQGVMDIYKLEKLCYYSQAWSLAWTGKPLFDEDFVCADNGPMSPDLHFYFDNFDIHIFFMSKRTLAKYHENYLNKDQKDTIKRVLKAYGNMQPYQLRDQTRSEKPWKDASTKNNHCIITKESMKKHYGSL